MAPRILSIDGLKFDREELAMLAAEKGIPVHCAGVFAGYLTGDNKTVGGFLRALLSNDLMQTVLRADDVNSLAIIDYVCFLYTYAPNVAWGSHEKVAAWLARETTEAE